MRTLVNSCLCVSLLSAPVVLCGGTLIEAESFLSRGGWTFDQQFIDSVGSSVLLAHGRGRPVADARTELFLGGGHHILYVRTRDWCAPHGPGAFTVVLRSVDGGERLVESQELGVGSGEWEWINVGGFDFKGGPCEVVLHDLTGFEGRVDALYFASPGEPPPKGWEERKRLLGLTATPATNVYDLVVVGGGIAGMCAAASAAREGLHVGIVQDRDCWGGNASREMRIKPSGDICDFPYRGVWDVVREVNQLFADSDGGEDWQATSNALDAWMAGIDGIDCFLMTRATGVNMAANGAIKSIVARNVVTGAETVLAADLFVDSTGDASIADMAGAECMSRIESWAETAEVLAPAMWEETGGYGSTIPWSSRIGDQISRFPRCPWAIQIDKWEDFLVFGERKGKLPTGCWNWEACIFDDPVADGERIRDHLFRAIYGTWDFIKNKCPERKKFECAELDHVGVALGKRAAKRVVGDYILTGTDILDSRFFEDGVVGIGWHLDMHIPARSQRARLGEEYFRSEPMPDDIVQRQRRRRRRNEPPAKRAVIPYRCLYSRDVPNLFVVGKILSATHVAMGACRVMNTCGAMGVVVGKAAAFCVKRKCRPRDISSGNALQEFLDFL